MVTRQLKISLEAELRGQEIVVSYLSAVSSALSIFDRICRLEGLDMPVRVNVAAKIRQVAEELALDEDEAVEEARRIL